MSMHTITYDLFYPGNGTMTCHAPVGAPCRAVWDCDCESTYGYHVKDGKPHHYSTYDDGISVRGHHVGRFDPDECNLCDWHGSSEGDVIGAVVVDVEPQWEGDYYTFRATAARLPEGETR